MLNHRYQTFLQVAKDLSFTTAARHLCMTQPTVSKHISYIESELNVKLFCFEQKQLYLTAEGKYLFNEILLLERHIAKIKQKLVGPTLTYTLYIGASRSIGEYYLPHYTRLFQPNDLHFDLTIGNTDFLLNALAKAEIDCALVSGPIDHFSGFSKRIFYEDRIVLVCAPDHPLAGQTVGYQDILSENFVLREKGSGIYQSLNSILSEHNRSCSDFTQAVTINNIGLIKNLLLQEPSLSFFYLTSIEEELSSGLLSEVKIADLNLNQKYYIVFNENLVYRSKIDFLYDLISKPV